MTIMIKAEWKQREGWRDREMDGEIEQGLYRFKPVKFMTFLCLFMTTLDGI